MRKTMLYLGGLICVAVAWAQEKKIITDSGDHKFGGDEQHQDHCE